MSRSDPIRKRYYEAVEKADHATDLLFYLGAALSLALLLIDKATHPVAYDWALIAFALATAAFFGVGLVSRLYWVPRAEDKRRQDFFTSACDVGLTHEQTEGYYNNDFTKPIERMAAQLLENSLFSKSIALYMAKTERIKVIVYAGAWLVCLLNRQTDLGVVVAVSQVIFSEQVLSKAIRLEWLRMRFEKTYDEVYRMFQARPTGAKFNAMTLDSLGMYETAKASGAVTLSSKVFEALNPTLSLEWDRIKAALRI